MGVWYKLIFTNILNPVLLEQSLTQWVMALVPSHFGTPAYKNRGRPPRGDPLKGKVTVISFLQDIRRVHTITLCDKKTDPTCPLKGTSRANHMLPVMVCETPWWSP